MQIFEDRVPESDLLLVASIARPSNLPGDETFGLLPVPLLEL
ncbi:hypothetical protein [Sphingopyxis fribergensis]